MLNKLKTLRNQAGEEGFTLIELLVVIIIIGILSAIALPLFFNQQSEGIKAGVKSDVRNTVSAVTTYLVKKPTAGDLAASKAGTGAATGHAAVVEPATTPEINVVVSDRNTTVTVSGAWNNYTVTGVHTQVKGVGGGNYTYRFTNSNGQYTEVSTAP